ncbi:MAG: asparagine synthase (glutamine-hydrolyzing) [Desulfobacterales bacterium]|nr:asparagine synthase (glutamine-hydrolyzing) [Desulfobacterales bacterium]
MCGIFGYTSAADMPALLQNMGQCLLHRGPDYAGYYVNNDDQINLGMRRLSIIDLAGGHQPIANERETIWIVCNGEIYNYVELRDELIKKGHRFMTHSDTEVLIHLYEEAGLDFLQDVNGMFGLALYDSSAKRLILARDRLGIKPVYYAWNGKQLAFASEIKPILLCPWVARDPDWEAISTYLHMLYVPAPRSPFKMIKKLEAGTIAILENGSMTFQKYWDMMPFLCNPAHESMSFEDASEHLHFLLKDACRIQLRSDVPVGAFLSGGVDSSAVVALTNSSASMGMDTFTIYWENAAEKMDERKFATDVAAKYGCNHHEVKISFDDFDRLLPLLAWHIEEPNADGAFVPTYVISKFASEKCKVILTGAGGDELFAGYEWYSSPFSIKQLMISILCRKQSRAYYKRAFNFPWRLVFPMYESNAAGNFADSYSNMFVTPDKLNAEMAFDLKVWLQDDILLLTDKMSMAASIEARVPLLDHRIVEFVLRLPSSYKIYAEDQKIIFKKAVGQYLPGEILARRKDGFGAPINSWMQGPLKAVSLNLLARGELIKQGIIDKQSLIRLNYLLRVKKEWSWALWILLNLELWFRFVHEGCGPPDDVRLSEL